nr:tubulin polyglutamylase TTLL11-like; partial [Biomphalaria glabrata]
MTSLKIDRDGELKMYQQKNSPYKTNFRQEAILKRRELTTNALLRFEKTQNKSQQERQSASRSLVTIDTHKARSNSEVLRLVIRDLGWREYTFPRRDQNCDVTWHAISYFDQSDIFTGQINKFPGSLEIFHKVNLFRWLEFMKSVFPEKYNFFPRTWFLPHQYNDFVTEVRSMNEKKPQNKPMFIVKPSEGSQGEGIYLLRDPRQYNHYNGRNHVIQEYLSDVFLIDKFKFDLRVYVVLKSIEPLEFHICREGLARFSTVPYEQPNNKNMAETFMHLTNYSLNKKSSEFKISDKDDEGSKRKLSAVFKVIEKLGHDVDLLWEKIDKMVTLTLIAVAGELKVELQGAIPPGKLGPTCFQILGFDILLLKDLEPSLLEVNSNPSLSITEEHETPTGGVEYKISSKDEEIKRKLIRDTLILIAPKNKYTRKRRKRTRRKLREGEEEMDVDTADSRSRHRRHRRREKAISIKFNDEDEGGDSKKSIFDESPKFVRTETCRVFIEGEGEVHFTEQGPTNSKYKSRHRNRKSSSHGSKNRKHKRKHRDPERMDTSDHLPPVIPSQEQEEVKTEDEDDQNVDAPHETSENSQEESSEEEYEEEESCLREIFPAVYGKSFEDERILEKIADIFISCLGVKGSMRMGPTMFRLFARKCRLNKRGITNAAIDILYIDMQRKFEYLNPDRTAGVCFFAFAGGCVRLASLFNGSSLTSQLRNFLEHCQTFMRIPSEWEAEAVLKARQRFSQRAREGMLEDGTEEIYELSFKGLCFLGFVSACYEIARQLFYSTSKSQMLRSVIDYCSQNLRDSQSAGSLQRRKKKYDPSQWRESSPQTEIGKGMTQKPVRFTTIRQLTSLDELTSFLKKDNLNVRRTRTLYGNMAD